MEVNLAKNKLQRHVQLGFARLRIQFSMNKGVVDDSLCQALLQTNVARIVQVYYFEQKK